MIYYAPELITPKEAVNIVLNFATAEIAERAVAVANEYRATARPLMSDTAFDRAWMLGAVYEAGRIQGMREERSRKKNRT